MKREESFSPADKCRMCGKVFVHSGRLDGERKAATLVGISEDDFSAERVRAFFERREPVFIPDKFIFASVVHICDDGSLGVADIIGMKRFCADE